MSQIRNHLKVLLAAVFMTFAAMASAAEADASLEAVRAKISAMFEFLEPEDVVTSPLDGWYMIQKGSIVAYVSADGRYLMQGDVIEIDTQQNLTELARSGVRRELVAGLGDEETILFSPENVKYSVTVFTDVDCTYCRKLHNEIDQYLEQGIEIRYVLYPRGGPASRAWTTSEDVWCAKDRNGALTAAKMDGPFETSKCDSGMITRHYSLGQDIGLSGTPAIVTEDGTLIAGYLPPSALSLRLHQQAAAD